jgi:hypothetical protein
MRIDGENGSVDHDMVAAGRCGIVLTVTGRRRRPEAGHDGGCQFGPPPGSARGSERPLGVQISTGLNENLRPDADDSAEAGTARTLAIRSRELQIAGLVEEYLASASPPGPPS